MSTRKLRQRFAGTDQAELQRLRKLYAGAPEALKAINSKLKKIQPNILIPYVPDASPSS